MYAIAAAVGGGVAVAAAVVALMVAGTLQLPHANFVRISGNTVSSPIIQGRAMSGS